MARLDTSEHLDGTEVGVHAGFPNAGAERTAHQTLSLDELLVPKLRSTYFFRVRGNSWEERGIFDGDIAVIDRSLTPTLGHTIVGWDETGELYITQYGQGKRNLSLWGVVTSIVHVLHEGGARRVPRPRNFSIENKFSSEGFLADDHRPSSPAAGNSK